MKGPFIAGVEDQRYLMVRMVQFDPDAVSGNSTRLDLVLTALLWGQSNEQMKDLTDTEKTAMKTYVLKYWSIRQHIQAAANLRGFLPVYLAGLTTDTYVLWTRQQFSTEQTLLNLEPEIPIFSELDKLVTLMNPVIAVEMSNDKRNYYGSRMTLWAPHLSLSAFRTLYAGLLAVSYDARKGFDKLGIKYGLGRLNLSPDIVVIPTHSWDDNWLFWWATLWHASNSSGIGYNYPMLYTGVTELDPTAANWEQNLIICYTYMGNPSILYDFVQFMYPYHANNARGCAVLCPDLCGTEVADTFAYFALWTRSGLEASFPTCESVDTMIALVRDTWEGSQLDGDRTTCFGTHTPLWWYTGAKTIIDNSIYPDLRGIIGNSPDIADKAQAAKEMAGEEKPVGRSSTESKPSNKPKGGKPKGNWKGGKKPSFKPKGKGKGKHK
jgi:hypothetical protein